MDNSRYLPAIGRFLIVVTFLEDALRIMTQWGDQLQYLHDYRHSTYSLNPQSPNPERPPGLREREDVYLTRDTNPLQYPGVLHIFS